MNLSKRDALAATVLANWITDAPATRRSSLKRTVLRQGRAAGNTQKQSRAGGGGGQRKPNLSQAAVTVPATCKYCGAVFWKPERSRQEYCKPDKERKKFMERKRALVVAVEQQLCQRGRVAVSETVARRCVDAEHDALLWAMVRLGWRYSEAEKVWRRG